MLTPLANIIRKFVRSSYGIYIFIIGIGIAAYGLHLSKLGFYWDDWPWVWLLHTKGAQGMLEIDQYHRPLSGKVLYLGGLFAGENPELWQIYALFLRLSGTGALAWALNKFWAQNKARTIWVVLLFLVYPGFNQQFVSVNNSRHLFSLALFFMSFGFMLKAIQDKRNTWVNTTISLMLSLATMLISEYYYGLEFIRPVLLWLYIRRDQKRFSTSVSSAFKVWIPYAVLLLFIFGWRYNISAQFNYSITIFAEISSNAGGGLSLFVRNAATDLYIATFGAWGSVFEISNLAESGKRIQFYYWIIVASISIGTLLYFSFLHQEENEKTWQAEALILGVAALVISPLPFWVAGLDPKLGFPEDRLLLPSALGASLLLAGTIDKIFKKMPIKIILLSIMIGLSVGSHNQNALVYRAAWSSTTSFFQQLSARAPNLPSSTTILSNQLPGRSTDNSLTAPLNWIYAPDFIDGNLPLQLLYVDLRFGSENTEINEERFTSSIYLEHPFKGSLEQVMVIYYAPPACLQIITPDSSFRNIPPPMEVALPYSNPDLILTGADLTATLPIFFEDTQQSHDWCYYFTKAELALQRQDWNQIAQLGDVAFTLKNTDNHISERIPFIEGYAHVGEWERAEKITLESSKLSPIFCQAWQRIKADTLPSIERDASLERIKTSLDCDL